MTAEEPTPDATNILLEALMNYACENGPPVELLRELDPGIEPFSAAFTEFFNLSPQAALWAMSRMVGRLIGAQRVLVSEERCQALAMVCAGILLNDAAPEPGEVISGNPTRLN